jgi:nucleotide-binding universal stress UspA family protein
VVEPVYGSVLGDLGAHAAAQLARRLGASLYVFTVARPLEVHRPHEHVARLARLLGGGVTTGVHQSTDTAASIIQESWRRESSIVCMATHGRSRSRALLGSVAGDVVARLHEPVILVGPNVDPDLAASANRVVVCVKGAAGADQLLCEAAAWASRFGVPAEIITVVEPTLPPDRPDRPVRRAHGPGDPDQLLRQVAKAWPAEDVAMTTAVVEDPVSVAVGVATYVRARPAALVVAGTDLRRGMSRLAAGDRSMTIVGRSPVPVLAVPLVR